MLISDLEAKLKELREKHGDIHVFKQYPTDTFRGNQIDRVSTAEYDSMCQEWYPNPFDKGDGVVIW